MCVVQYDAELSRHYGSAAPPALDGISSPVYDPAAVTPGGHHASRVTGSLPSAGALPRSPTYSPHPSAASLASPYPAAGTAGAGGGVGGYSASAAAAAAAAMNSSSSAAAVAAVDNLLKRDKDAIYRYVIIH